MANINTNNGKGGKKGTPTRMNLRVDFTPMVDMNMLLITFFMFCTSLATPQVMDIVMPTRDAYTGGTEFPEFKTITLLLGHNSTVYYYLGIPDYDDPTTLKKTDLSDVGLRGLLLGRNSDIVDQVRELKIKKMNKEITEDVFKSEIAKLKKSNDSQQVIIKPTDGAEYNDVIQTLDEMQICSISKYAIVDLSDGDKYLLEKAMKDELLAQAK